MLGKLNTLKQRNVPGNRLTAMLCYSIHHQKEKEKNWPNLLIMTLYPNSSKYDGSPVDAQHAMHTMGFAEYSKNIASALNVSNT